MDPASWYRYMSSEGYSKEYVVGKPSREKRKTERKERAQMAGTKEQIFAGTWEKLSFAQGKDLQKVLGKMTAAFNSWKTDPANSEKWAEYDRLQSEFRSSVATVEAHSKATADGRSAAEGKKVK